MKAVIVKNSELETIAIEVTEGDQKIFNWGEAEQPNNLVQEIDVIKNIDSIMELIRLDSQISARANFQNDLFSVLQDTGIKIKGVQFDLRGHELKTMLMQEKIITIINRLK